MRRKQNRALGNRIYFGQKEEEAIAKYIKEESKEERERIYNKIIHPCFLKLSENIVNTYGLRFGFFNLGISNQNLIDNGVSYMYSKLVRFDPDRLSKSGGAVKAFSFFGTILKRYYIKECIDAQKSTTRNVELDNSELFIDYSDEIGLYYDDKYIDDEKIFLTLLVRWFEQNINLFNNKDIPIIKSVIEIFKKIDMIENFNKKYIYIQIREMTGESTMRITSVINRMKSYYKHLRWNYINYGELKSGSIDI